AREYGFCTPDRLDDRHWTQQANFHVQRRRARAVRCDVELDHRPSVKVLAGHQQARELKKRESRIAVCTLAWRASIDHSIFGAAVCLWNVRKQMKRYVSGSVTAPQDSEGAPMMLRCSEYQRRRESSRSPRSGSSIAGGKKNAPVVDDGQLDRASPARALFAPTM